MSVLPDNIPAPWRTMNTPINMMIDEIYRENVGFGIFPPLRDAKSRILDYPKINRISSTAEFVDNFKDATEMQAVTFDNEQRPLASMIKRYSFPDELVKELNNGVITDAFSRLLMQIKERNDEDIDALLFRGSPRLDHQGRGQVYGLQNYPGITTINSTATGAAGATYSANVVYMYRDWLAALEKLNEMNIKIRNVRLRSVTSLKIDTSQGQLSTFENMGVDLIERYCEKYNIDHRFESTPFLYPAGTEETVATGKWFIIPDAAQAACHEFDGVKVIPYMIPPANYELQVHATYIGALIIGRPEKIVCIENIHTS